MKITVMVGGVPQEVEVGTKIGRTTAEFATLFTCDNYDASTGTGLITVGDKKIVFVKDDATGYTFPIVWEKGKDAQMVVDIRVKDGKFSFSTALNQKVDKRTVVETTVGTPEYDALADLKSKFDARYVTGADHDKEYTNLIRLYKNFAPAVATKPRPDKKPIYQSFIIDFIPVKNADGTDATIIIAPNMKDGKVERGTSAYYVPSKIDRSACLVDDKNFDSLSAVLLSSIVPTSGKDFDVKLADGRELNGLIYEGTTTDIVDDMDGFETDFGTDYTNGKRVGPIVTPPAKLIPGGIDVHHYGKFDLKHKKTPTAGCFLVGPHAENEGEDAPYRVVGANTAWFEAQNLTRDEFMAILKRNAFGTASFTEAKKATVGVPAEPAKLTRADGSTLELLDGMNIVGVKTHLLYTDKAGNAVIRVIPHEGLTRKLGLWGRHQLDALYVDTKNADGSSMKPDDVTRKLNELSGGSGLANGLGTKNRKSIGWAKIKIAVKHVAVAVLVAASILVGSLVYANLNKAQADLTAMEKQQIVTTVESLDKNEQLAKDAALNALVDESNEAAEAGKQAAIDAAKDCVIIGQQFRDGTWEEYIEEYFTAPHTVYTHKNGLNYQYKTFKEGDYIIFDENGNPSFGVALDENGKVKVIEVTGTLTADDFKKAGKTYTYTEEYEAARFKQGGIEVANQAIKAGKVVLKAENGKTSVVITYAGGSREKMVEIFNKKLGEGMGEFATSFYEIGFTEAVKEAQKDNQIGASGVEDEDQILKSEAVLIAASRIAGANAVVTMSEDLKTAYVISENRSVVYKVPVSGDLTSLSEDLVEAYGKKGGMEKYTRAIDSFSRAMPGKDFSNSKYANTYVSGTPETSNGKTVYQAKTIALDVDYATLNMTATEGEGLWIIVARDAFNQDVSVTISLIGMGASVKPEVKQQYQTSETKPNTSVKTTQATAGKEGK